MLVKDIKHHFYDAVQHQRVLVLVAFDVDALCACKILQYLFHTDQVLYTVVPVNGIESLENAFVENSEGVKYVVLINCGATVDIVELLQPEEHVRFFICDSHRPVDVHNYYNAVQVKLLMEEDDVVVPSYDEVFRDDDEDSDSGNDSDDSETGYKKKRFDDESIIRRQERRRWNENRVKVLFDHSKFTSYGTSCKNIPLNSGVNEYLDLGSDRYASLVMFELAWKLSKDTNSLLWLAIVGVTDQFVHYRIPRDKYMKDVITLQSHVSRHNQRLNDDENLLSINCLRISFEEELNISLYRHWTLFDSICHSAPFACKFRLWSLKGQKRLHEFLAEMGLPLIQCKQQFSAMDSTVRSEVKDKIKEFMTKYGLEPLEVILPSFSLQYGYKNITCATDYVYACAAILESVDPTKSATDNFLLSSEAVSRTNPEQFDKGLEAAKLQKRSIVSQVQTFIDMHSIISAGPFLYTFVTEGSTDFCFFTKPQCLIRLARFTLEGHCSVSRNKRAPSLPLVLAVPQSLDEGTCLVVGIPPLDTDDERKNFFGKAFEQAALSSKSTIKFNGFDANIIEMKTEERSKFFDALISTLQ